MFTTFDQIPWHLPAPSRRPARILHMLPNAVRAVARRLQRRRQLGALRALDDHLLRDIGLSRADVVRACARPFWERRDPWS